MYPVNRSVVELTPDELLNLYDEARRVDLNHASDTQVKAVQELRGEIIRRLGMAATYAGQQLGQSLLMQNAMRNR